MKETRYYKVAEHVFCVSGEAEWFALTGNYEPFGCDEGEALFALGIGRGEAPAFEEELKQEDEGQDIICGRTGEGEPVFEFRWWNETAGWLVCSEDYREGRLIMTGKHVEEITGEWNSVGVID